MMEMIRADWLWKTISAQQNFDGVRSGAREEHLNPYLTGHSPRQARMIYRLCAVL